MSLERFIKVPGHPPDSGAGRRRKPGPIAVASARGRKQDTKTVPFDYAVTLALSGVRDNIVQNIIGVSIEGYFVTTAISYSLLIDERVTPVNFGTGNCSTTNGNGTDDDVDIFSTPDIPRTQDVPTELVPITPFAVPVAAKQTRVFGEPHAVVQVMRHSKGRQGQDEPGRIREVARFTLDASGRGESNFTDSSESPWQSGDMIFVNDLTNDLTGPDIFLATARVGGGVLAKLMFGSQKPAAGSATFEIIGTPDEDLEIWLVEREGEMQEPTLLDESHTIPSVEDDDPGFLTVNLQEPLAPGDTILVRYKRSNLSAVFRIRIPSVVEDVFEVKLSQIPFQFLKQGFRVTPSLAERIEAGVTPPPTELAKPFQPCGFSTDDLSFLYTIKDNATGRELQSGPIHNIAGLGISNGDRPFRIFPKPIVFAPKSTILFQVQEIFGGPGTLYFVLHGYKVLGTSEFGK
ncbi:MAG: hypothetical protein ACE5I1_01165 [bacterium]